MSHDITPEHQTIARAAWAIIELIRLMTDCPDERHAWALAYGRAIAEAVNDPFWPQGVAGHA